jgi:hypothetical protein
MARGRPGSLPPLRAGGGLRPGTIAKESRGRARGTARGPDVDEDDLSDDRSRHGTRTSISRLARLREVERTGRGSGQGGPGISEALNRFPIIPGDRVRLLFVRPVNAAGLKPICPLTRRRNLPKILVPGLFILYSKLPDRFFIPSSAPSRRAQAACASASAYASRFSCMACVEPSKWKPSIKLFSSRI